MLFRSSPPSPRGSSPVRAAAIPSASDHASSDAASGLGTGSAGPSLEALRWVRQYEPDRLEDAAEGLGAQAPVARPVETLTKQGHQIYRLGDPNSNRSFIEVAPDLGG